MDRSEILLEFDRHGILPTPQRLEIAEILLEKAQHLSADQIIEQLRARGSGVSKATVYNTLNLFDERGLVKERSFDPERRYYDSVTAPHHHFFNVDTGELIDIPADAITLEKIPDYEGQGRLESVEVLIKIRKD
ncbi:MAG: Fur family transcriptional regulator [Woeseiaceae bacterium]|nr:Fur family transcriptional regulator [Woeseiaceae bacterium]